MAKRAILHQATRVIRRLTIDDAHQAGPGEIAVAVPEDFQLSQGTFTVVQNDGTIRTATDQEVDTAEVDPVREQQKARARRQAMIQAIDNAIANPSVATIRAYLIAQRAMIRG